MGLRFRRSIKIAPGIKVNLTKTGWGMTVGPRGNHYSVHSSGRRTRTVGLPGTGLYYQSVSGGGRASTSRTRPQRSTPTPAATLAEPRSVIPNAGLFASSAEKAYHAGVLAYLRQDLPSASAMFEQVLAHDPAVSSAHLFAGLAALGLEDSPRAIAHLEAVVGGHALTTDRFQAHYLGDPRLDLGIRVKITSGVSVNAPFGPLGATLILAELYQSTNRSSEAIGLVEQIHTVVPDSRVRLSLADLLFADHDYEGAIEVTDGVSNDGDLAAEMLHIRGAAMIALGHVPAAIDVFRAALAKTAGRDPALLLAIRYDRGLAYEQIGQHSRARTDLERVYAADPSFEDVKARLVAMSSTDRG